MNKINADWSEYNDCVQWSHVTSRELSKILNVSLQTISNWKMRDKLPEPTTKFKGNRNYYRISAIRSWLENKPAEQIEWEWVQDHLPEHDFKNLDQAKHVINICYNIFGFKRPLF